MSFYARTPPALSGVQVASKQLVGVYLSVWVRKGLLPHVHGVQVRAGPRGRMWRDACVDGGCLHGGWLGCPARAVERQMLRPRQHAHALAVPVALRLVFR